jgi:hypothetical protein
MLFHFALLWQSSEAYENVESTQVFSNKRLGKLTRGNFFASLSFGDKFEFSAFSPT